METVIAPQNGKFPAVVLKLAEEVNGQPLAYRDTKTEVIIVFIDGRKLTFVKESAVQPAEPARSATLPAPLTDSAQARKTKSKEK